MTYDGHHLQLLLYLIVLPSHTVYEKDHTKRHYSTKVHKTTHLNNVDFLIRMLYTDLY